MRTYRIGSILSMFFTTHDVRDLETVMQSDAGAYGRFFHAMLVRGVSLAPSAYEVGFVSTAHSMADIDDTIAAVHEALAMRSETATAL